ILFFIFTFFLKITIASSIVKFLVTETYSVLINDPDVSISKFSFLFILNLPPLFIYYLGDRKSTRLNSSHVSISYAVFCLKKKKIIIFNNNLIIINIIN